MAETPTQASDEQTQARAKVLEDPRAVLEQVLVALNELQESIAVLDGKVEKAQADIEELLENGEALADRLEEEILRKDYGWGDEES